MGLIELASGNSVWRGMDYYEAKRVMTWVKSGQYIYDGIVSGNEGKVYHVHIDTARSIPENLSVTVRLQRIAE